MDEESIANGALVVLLLLVGIAAAVAARARSEITRSFRRFSAEHGLKYAQNPSQWSLPGLEEAWFMNIPGAHMVRFRDVCSGRYDGSPMVHLKYQYMDRYANYLTVFIFATAWPTLPRILLWPQATGSDLRRLRRWQCRELASGRLLYAEQIDDIPGEVYRWLVGVARDRRFDESRIELLGGHLIVVPHGAMERADDDFSAYLQTVTMALRGLGTPAAD